MNEDVINCSCHIINKWFWNACIPTASTTKQTNIRMNVVHFQFEIVENGTHTHTHVHFSCTHYIYRMPIEKSTDIRPRLSRIFREKMNETLPFVLFFSVFVLFLSVRQRKKKKKNSITITIITPTPFNYLSTLALLCNYIIAFLFSVFDIFQRCCVVVVVFLSIFFAFFWNFNCFSFFSNFFFHAGRAEPSVGVGDHCAGCNKPILDKFLLNVCERRWHTSCVRCCDCLTLLTEKCFSRDAQLYCKKDFFRWVTPFCPFHFYFVSKSNNKSREKNAFQLIFN